MPMKITDLHNNKILKEKDHNVEISIFYSKYVDTETYNNLRNNPLKMISLFTSTYTRNHNFSVLKIVELKTRVRLSDIHLENSHIQLFALHAINTTYLIIILFSLLILLLLLLLLLYFCYRILWL